MTWCASRNRGAPAGARRRRPRRPRSCRRAAAAETPAHKDDEREHDREHDAFDLVLATIDALIAERGEDEKIWGSMVKQALKRRKPGFNESYYGFRSFNKLLEEAAARRLITLERDDKSGGYVIHSVADPA